MSKILLLSTSYFPCINTFSLYVKHLDNVIIESNEYFIRHSMQNRAKITTSNGPLYLTIPIVKRNKTKIKIKNIKISNSYSWQKLHLKTIYTNYKNSPFYDFYEDNFIRLYSKPYNYLIDINNEALDMLLKLLNISCKLQLTDEYKKNYCANILDYRGKIIYSKSSCKQYNQVFEDKVGFLHNASIIDLLFNQGPEAKNILLK